MNRCLDKGNGLARWSKAGSTTTPCPPTFACSVRSASMLSTSGGARSGGAGRRTSRHGKGSKVSRVNGCLLPRSSIRGRLTASASNTRGGSRMRESRPYGSERGAFSNGRPYRDRTDGNRGRGEISSSAAPLFPQEPHVSRRDQPRPNELSRRAWLVEVRDSNRVTFVLLSALGPAVNCAGCLKAAVVTSRRLSLQQA